MTLTLADIPAGLTSDQLVAVLNDRLRSIAQAVSAGAGPTNTDLNMAGFRVVTLGDPLTPQDALNLRTGDARYAKVTATVAKAAAAGTSGTLGSKTTSSASGTLILTVPGTLAIQSSATPVLVFSQAMSWKSITILATQGPVGAPLTIAANAGAGQLGSVSIPDGGLRPVTLAISWVLPAGSLLTFDVTSVGLTFPGSGLTIELS
jgi:hypothetical protein